jgi:hypothetical protein
MLHINPKMVPRLNELQADLEERRDRAVAEGWVGEIEVIQLTLRFLRDKRGEALRISRTSQQARAVSCSAAVRKTAYFRVRELQFRRER